MVANCMSHILLYDYLVYYVTICYLELLYYLKSLRGYLQYTMPPGNVREYCATILFLRLFLL
jgi:hypothetical protein